MEEEDIKEGATVPCCVTEVKHQCFHSWTRAERQKNKQTEDNQRRNDKKKENKLTDFNSFNRDTTDSVDEGWRDGADGGMEAQVDVELDTNQ